MNETWNQQRHAMHASGLALSRQRRVTTDAAGSLASRSDRAVPALPRRRTLRFCWWSRQKIRSSSVTGRVSIQSIYYRSAPAQADVVALRTVDTQRLLSPARTRTRPASESHPITFSICWRNELTTLTSRRLIAGPRLHSLCKPYCDGVACQIKRRQTTEQSRTIK